MSVFSGFLVLIRISPVLDCCSVKIVLASVGFGIGAVVAAAISADVIVIFAFLGFLLKCSRYIFLFVLVRGREAQTNPCSRGSVAPILTILALLLAPR